MKKIENCIHSASEAKNAQWAKDHTHVCPICGETFVGYGNNPYPISKTGRCCDDCNYHVIRMRMLFHSDLFKCIDNDVNEAKANPIGISVRDFAMGNSEMVMALLYDKEKAKVSVLLNSTHYYTDYLQKSIQNYLDDKFNDNIAA